jgi:spore germination protein GerM
VTVRTVVLRVVALALLLLLAVFGALALRTLQRLPDTVIYLIRDEGTSFTLEAVARRMRPAGALEAARAAVAALAEGPTPEEASNGLASAVPAGTTVRSVAWVGDVLVVDLDAAVVSGGGTSSMVGRLAQLTYTLTQPRGVAAVELLVDGRALGAWGGEGVMVTWPWRRPEGALPRW